MWTEEASAVMCVMVKEPRRKEPCGPELCRVTERMRLQIQEAEMRVRGVRDLGGARTHPDVSLDRCVHTGGDPGTH